MAEKPAVIKNKQLAPVTDSPDKNLAETLIAQAIEKNVPLETMEKLLAMRKE
jgi:hypothetical protein